MTEEVGEQHIFENLKKNIGPEWGSHPTSSSSNIKKEEKWQEGETLYKETTKSELSYL